jgi:putative ABC transport system permease protein
MRLYFLTGIRNMRKQFGYTSLNVLGLTLGIATCLTIFLVVRYELSYDAFNHKAARTYKVNLHGGDYNPCISLAIAPALRVDFPELEQVSQVWYRESATVKVDNSLYDEKQLSFADGHLPQVFDYNWLQGDAKTALAAPGSVVLTESVARKYFGAKDPMGRELSVNEGTPYKVTGVIRDLPGNTHLPVRAFFSFSTIEPEVKDMMRTFWAIPGGSFVYIVLPPNVRASTIQARMHNFIAKNWGKDVAKDADLLLQPLRDIHFEQQYNQTSVYQTTARQTYLALGGIALFIIIIACINFINLSTGLAISRAREVGVRKVLGAGRPQLIAQFMGETTILVLVSVVLGLGAATLVLPTVNGWLGTRVSVAELYEGRVLGLLALMTFGVILLAGLYPSFVQSAFQPALSLKGVRGTRKKGLTLRKGLVVLQFTISQLLIIGTIIVARQMDFFQNQDLGFNKESAISLYMRDRQKNPVMAEAMAANPGVAGYSFNSASPVDNHNFTEFHSAELGLPKGDVAEIKFVDERYIRMFDMHILAGDTIAPQSGKDTLRRAVVNETMLGKLHLRPDNALGKRFTLSGWTTEIIGVVADFQSESKHLKRRSCALLYDSSRFFEMCVKVKPGGMQGTLASIGKSWSALFPEGLFTYQFLDDHIAGLYRQEQKVYTAFRLFAGIAILIGCLGLYGLVAFAAVQRTKEVGVRKVLGASMTDIVFLFSKEFVVLIGIAFVAAAPVAWMVMSSWLNDFAYRISIGWGTFAVAIVVSVVIAAMTISWESVKAAIVNPVKSLRSE